jgi:hypothetical protein
MKRRTKLPRPFDYAVSAPGRRHEPAGYDHVQRFKPWLRDEFKFRCVYCLFRERWYGSGCECFSVDHLVPRSEQGGSERECEYQNLTYSCLRCNANRGAQSVLNPNENKFHEHLTVNEQNGWIEGLSPLGDKTVRLLKLNHPRFIDRRKQSFMILSLKHEFPNHPKAHELFVREFGFPDDLPDLRTLKPPKGNPTNSEKSCYYVLRERGKLPEVY